MYALVVHLWIGLPALMSNLGIRCILLHVYVVFGISGGGGGYSQS